MSVCKSLPAGSLGVSRDLTSGEARPQNVNQVSIGREEDLNKSCNRPCPHNEGTLTEESATTDPKSEDDQTAESLSSRDPIYSVFSRPQKRYIVFVAALAGLFSTLSTNIYFPALNSLAKNYNVSDELISLTVTSYMIFQALAPTIYGDLADMAGRRPAYCIGFTIYIAANIGLALQDNYAALLVLRCLQSSGSSGTIAMGAGMVADVATSAERGSYMGLVMSVSTFQSFHFPRETSI